MMEGGGWRGRSSTEYDKAEIPDSCDFVLGASVFGLTCQIVMIVKIVKAAGQDSDHGKLSRCLFPLLDPAVFSLSCLFPYRAAPCLPLTLTPAKQPATSR